MTVYQWERAFVIIGTAGAIGTAIVSAYALARRPPPAAYKVAQSLVFLGSAAGGIFGLWTLLFASHIPKAPTGPTTTAPRP